MMGQTPPKKMCVLFFGSKQFGFVDSDKIVDYKENREKFTKKGRGFAFKDAVKKMDEFISDPVVNLIKILFNKSIFIQVFLITEIQVKCLCKTNWKNS